MKATFTGGLISPVGSGAVVSDNLQFRIYTDATSIDVNNLHMYAAGCRVVVSVVGFE